MHVAARKRCLGALDGGCVTASARRVSASGEGPEREPATAYRDPRSLLVRGSVSGELLADDDDAGGGAGNRRFYPESSTGPCRHG